MLALVLLPLLTRQTAAVSLKVAECRTGIDCTLGGRCKEGRCECYPAWRGSRCEQLAIGEAREAGSNGYRNAKGASWGGSVIHGDDGWYHMYVSYMNRDCSLLSWKYNSVIHHAVASSPEGPYTHKKEILHEFAHNPAITRAPDGTYLLYHIGETLYKVEQTTYLKDCRKDSEAEPTREAQRKSATNFDGRIRIAYSNSTDGPWTLLNHGKPILQPQDGQFWDTVVTNPAPLVLKNGSVLLYYRGDDRKSPTFRGKRHRKIGVAFAESWKGPYKRLSDLPITSSGEDPVVWANADGSGYHMIFENKFQGIVGQHAYSTDGLDWHVDPEPLYDLGVAFPFGNISRLERRERPQLLRGTNGEPTYLFNAVQGMRKRSNSSTSVQSTWTMAVPLGKRLPANPPMARMERIAE